MPTHLRYSIMIVTIKISPFELLAFPLLIRFYYALENTDLLLTGGKGSPHALVKV